MKKCLRGQLVWCAWMLQPLLDLAAFGIQEKKEKKGKKSSFFSVFKMQSKIREALIGSGQ